MWQRAVRIRVLSSGSVWGAQNYTADQILSMISDLKPTMLHRYITGYQDPSLQVPVCFSCAPMTVQQFLQASEAGSNSFIVARISIWEYDNGTLFSTSKNLLSIQLNPPIRMLSLDDFDGWIKVHDAYTFVNIANELYNQGWIWVETGGAGSQGSVPDWTTNYASAIFSQPDFTVSPIGVQKWFSKPDIHYVLASQSFPTDISYLKSLPTDQLAAIYSNVAANQTSHGYHMIYFILQGKWDTNQINIASGPYAGMTLYAEMKQLMNTYNNRI